MRGRRARVLVLPGRGGRGSAIPVRLAQDRQHLPRFHHHSASCEGWAWAAHVMKLGPVAGRYELASIGKPVGEESAEVHRTIPLPIGAAFRALHDLYLDD